MIKVMFLALVLLAGFPRDSRAEDEKGEATCPTEAVAPGIAHRIAFYLPNRILDLLDVFRLRLRVGPGIAAGARATRLAQCFAGSYVSLYAGLPGPRMRQTPRLPVGMESHSGIDMSILEASVSGGMNPDYSPTEFGAGAQFLLAGVDLGFDPYEVLDLIAGVLGFDLRDDDL